MKKSKTQSLREIIREMIKQELEENSTSAATPGYLTPNAFVGNPEDKALMVTKGLGNKKEKNDE